MANSFGYFIDEKENLNVLREAFRLLLPGGYVFLDLINKDYAVSNLSPESWHEADEDIVVCRRRTCSRDIIFTREMVVSKARGLIRDAQYCTRLYSPEKISKSLRSAGFSSIAIQKDIVAHGQEGDYGCMTNRMVVTARRPW
jgi:hypothetical protein